MPLVPETNSCIGYDYMVVLVMKRDLKKDKIHNQIVETSTL